MNTSPSEYQLFYSFVFRVNSSVSNLVDSEHLEDWYWGLLRDSRYSQFLDDKCINAHQLNTYSYIF